LSTVTLFDLLGVSADNLDGVVARWPAHAVQGSTGQRKHPDLVEARAILEFLNAALTFRNIRPGADPQRVGLTAEMVVTGAPMPMPLVLAALPDVEFHLQPTGSTPARLTVTSGDLGIELIAEAVPVEIKLPIGFIQPLAKSGFPDPDSETPIDSFIVGRHDTLRVVLKSHDQSSIFVHVRVRMTEDGRFVIEPAVPISVGPCRFSGLPCRAVHDLGLFPSPRLGVGPGDEEHYGDQALEWTRHPLQDEGASEFGLMTVRSVDLDETRGPLSDLRGAINPGSTADQFEWVLEDLAFPIGSDPLPIPSHFLVGLRRELKPGDDPAGAYNVGGLAVPLGGIASILHFKYLLIEKLLFRSVPSPELNPIEADRQFAFVKVALTETPTGEGNSAFDKRFRIFWRARCSILRA
jgi:hypothetical protein